MFFCFGDVSQIKFSEWLYDCKDVEETFGKDDYFELIEKNYYKSQEVYEAKELVLKICDKRGIDLRLEYTINVLERMLNKYLPLSKGCEILRIFYDEGCDYIPIVFVGYDSELDTPEKEKLWLNFYRHRIINDCTELLSTLRFPELGEINK